MSRKPIDTEAVVRNLPLFQALGPGEIRAIAQEVSVFDVPRKAVIYRRGDPSLGFHVVLLGQVKLALEGHNGDEKVMDVIKPLQSFGEAVMFLGKPHVATAQAIADSKLLFVPRDAVLPRVDSNGRFARTLIASVSARFHRLMGDMHSYALETGTERVIGYLSSIVPEEPMNGGTHRAILSATKGVIASRLNLTQEHFSRILHALAADGLIVVRGREVEIPDLGRLRGHTAATT